MPTIPLNPTKIPRTSGRCWYGSGLSVTLNGYLYVCTHDEWNGGPIVRLKVTQMSESRSHSLSTLLRRHPTHCCSDSPCATLVGSRAPRIEIARNGFARPLSVIKSQKQPTTTHSSAQYMAYTSQNAERTFTPSPHPPAADVAAPTTDLMRPAATRCAGIVPRAGNRRTDRPRGAGVATATGDAGREPRPNTTSILHRGQRYHW